ncbi:MAG TPA: ABC transporter permease [Acidobacteriaceae bacterium]|nr:ABC transporter permease [Acidobacteriaceae bacterium]
MSWWRRVRNLGRRERVDAEIAEELAAHVEMAADEAVRNGAGEAEARRTARLRFGNPVAVREQTAGADAALGLAGVGRDVKHALRQMRRSPGFAAAAIATLALGIGATTAIFTLIEQVMLRSLPVEKPQQLWRIGDSVGCCYSNGYTQSNEQAQNDWSFFSWEAYKAFRANTPGFADLAAFEPGEGNAELAVRRMGSAAAPEPRNGEYVSGSFFRTFGAAAWRGRVFTDADDREGAPPVAVMSFHTWQENYGSDPSVVGGTYEMNGHTFTVIGVAPPSFYGARVAAWGMPDVWLPLAAEPVIAGGTSRLKNPASAWLDLIGRVRPGTNPRALQAQLQGELQAWLASHVAEMDAQEKALWRKQTLRLTPGGGGVSLMREAYGRDLKLLLAAAFCVLLLACANLASLLLARGLRNRRQTAVRVALGASRGRLIRKAVVESVMLGLAGGAAGIAVAIAGAKLILQLAFARSAQSSWIPVQGSVSLPALLFALGLAAMTGVAFGVAPAWITSRAEPIEAMRAVRTMGGDRPGAQKALVVVQAALSLVLLSAAAMLGQSLRNREHQDWGFDPRGRYLVSIDPKLSNYRQDELAPLFREIEAQLRAIPGVRSVGAVLEAPPGGWITHEIRIEGQAEPGPGADLISGWTRVTPGFFPTYAERIVRGRAISEEDTAATRPVAVVNEAFAKKFFGGQNAIGQHFGPAPERNAAMYEIVGVAANVEFENDLQQPMYLLPEAQSTSFVDANTESREVWSHYLYNVAIWAPGSPPDLEARVKKALGDAAPDLTVYGMESYVEAIRDGFAAQNMIATLTWMFGGIGLLLTAVGLYGVTAYGVEQRTGEIGVRMALGADRGSVVAMVLRGAFAQVGLGIAVGIPVAIGTGRALGSRLFGVQPWSPALLGLAAVALLLTAVVAGAIPARRAAGVDPMESLRAE